MSSRSVLKEIVKMQTSWSGSSKTEFFLQAEDGIRDIGVTGVQTCALPILRVTLVATGIGQAEELTLPRTPVLQQQVQQQAQAAYQPQAQPAQPAFAQPQQGYTQQPAQFSQPQPAAAKPQQVDSSQVWSPNSIPGFMRNGQ